MKSSWRASVLPNYRVRWISDTADKLTSREYEQIAEATLEGLVAYFEELNDNNTLASEFDCNYSVCVSISGSSNFFRVEFLLSNWAKLWAHMCSTNSPLIDRYGFPVL